MCIAICSSRYFQNADVASSVSLYAVVLIVENYLKWKCCFCVCFRSSGLWWQTKTKGYLINAKVRISVSSISAWTLLVWLRIFETCPFFPSDQWPFRHCFHISLSLDVCMSHIGFCFTFLSVENVWCPQSYWFPH